MEIELEVLEMALDEEKKKIIQFILNGKRLKLTSSPG